MYHLLFTLSTGFMIFLFLVRFHPDMLSDSNSIGKPFRWASESEHYVSKGFHNVLSLISIASNELESDSISGWNLTQAYNNRLDLGAYRTYYKGFTCFFNNTVLRGAGLNGCAIFVRKYWDRTVWRWCIFYFLGLGCFEMMHFLLSGSSTLPLKQQLAGATGFFRTSSDWGVPSVCFLSSRKRVVSLGGKGAWRPDRKEGIPIHLRQCKWDSNHCGSHCWHNDCFRRLIGMVCRLNRNPFFSAWTACSLPPKLPTRPSNQKIHTPASRSDGVHFFYYI